jgi:hypothetical protein
MNNDFGRFELEQAHARARTELASAQRDVEAVERAAAVNLDADEAARVKELHERAKARLAAAQKAFAAVDAQRTEMRRAAREAQVKQWLAEAVELEAKAKELREKMK